MLNETDFKNIRRLLNENDKKGFFKRRRQQKNKRQLIKEIEELSETHARFYIAKVQQEKREIERQTKKINNETIKDSIKGDDDILSFLSN